MSGKVPIRVPTGSPVNAFLSGPAPLAGPPAPEPQGPPSSSPPRPPARAEVEEAPSMPAAVAPRARATPAGPQQEAFVRFQIKLPVRLARLLDAERDRRVASGRRGRGKSDYTAIFRDLVDKHLR
jgi:hypothetical protein